MTIVEERNPTLAEINPDYALAALLDGLEIQTSPTQNSKVKAYAEEGRPNTNLPDMFVSVSWNGGAKAIVKPMGIFRGNLALWVFVKTLANRTVNRNVVRQIIAQCQRLADGVESKEGYYFELDVSNVITPTTVNILNGYSMTVLNVLWSLDNIKEEKEIEDTDTDTGTDTDTETGTDTDTGTETGTDTDTGTDTETEKELEIN